MQNTELESEQFMPGGINKIKAWFLFSNILQSYGTEVGNISNI